MKKQLLRSLLFLITIQLTAQKEFWGLNTYGGSIDNYGAIFKTDVSGSNPAFVHLFNLDDGMRPYGRLFLASNGKIYGCASEGGNNSGSFTAGVIFEYDLITETFSVVSYLGTGEQQGITRPLAGLTESVPGKLAGNGDGVIFQYDITTQSTSLSYGPINFFPEYYIPYVPCWRIPKSLRRKPVRHNLLSGVMPWSAELISI